MKHHNHRICSVAHLVSLAVLLLPTVSLGDNHQIINNWTGGSDIMVDAFSNSIMPSAPAGFDALPIDTLAIKNTTPEDTTCIDSYANCNTIIHQDALSYEEVATASFFYLRLTIVNTAYNSNKPLKLSYQYSLFLPNKQAAGDFLQGLASKQIIRDQVDHFLYAPNFKKADFPPQDRNSIKAQPVWLNRLNQAFTNTNTELNFSDKNFSDLVSAFSKKTNKLNTKQPAIQITQKTSTETASDTNTPQLLSQKVEEDKSGVDDIIWLEDKNTTTTQIDNNSVTDITGQDITLSYQPLDNFSPNVSPKESIDQNLPQQANPFSWKPSPRIDFNGQSPF